MNRKTLLISFLALGLLALGGIYKFIYNKPHTDVERTKEVYNGTAEGLYVAFETNEASASEQYRDQVVRVSGTIFEVTQSGERLSVILDAGNPMGGGLKAAMAASISKESFGWGAGDQIFLKGICSGLAAEEDGLLGALGASVELTDCLPD